jgi:hypothetical protein
MKKGKWIFNVEVTKAGKLTYWYGKYVGAVFKVEVNHKSSENSKRGLSYLVLSSIHGKYRCCFIRACDCKRTRRPISSDKHLSDVECPTYFRTLYLNEKRKVDKLQKELDRVQGCLV